MNEPGLLRVGCAEGHGAGKPSKDSTCFSYDQVLCFAVGHQQMFDEWINIPSSDIVPISLWALASAFKLVILWTPLGLVTQTVCVKDSVHVPLIAHQVFPLTFVWARFPVGSFCFSLPMSFCDRWSTPGLGCQRIIAPWEQPSGSDLLEGVYKYVVLSPFRGITLRYPTSWR